MQAGSRCCRLQVRRVNAAKRFDKNRGNFLVASLGKETNSWESKGDRKKKDQHGVIEVALVGADDKARRQVGSQMTEVRTFFSDAAQRRGTICLIKVHDEGLVAGDR